MFVILSYDVNKKRSGKILKICRKYLVHVQKSVFEGNITESRLSRLKSELYKIIEPEEDAICLYKLNSVKYTRKECIGLIEDNVYVI